MSAAPLLLLIDGHSLAFRAYYAFATTKKGPLRTATGIPTSVCFGFLNSLIQAIEAQKPAAIAIAFDRREPTFRHEADANYKADRQETPEEFITDLANLRALLAALNLQTITYPGYEADDILGALAKQGSGAGYQVKIVSGDRDLFQLVSDEDNIQVLYLSRNPFQNAGYSEFNRQAVIEKMGVTPEQIVDYKALCGDASDNIPGVRGIGEKTAIKLLQEYPTLAAIYDNLPNIKGAVKKKLEEGESSAKHSQHLAQIIVDIPLEINLENLHLQGFNSQTLKPLLEQLELRTFLEKLNQIQQQLGGESLSPQTITTQGLRSVNDQQLSLFNSENSSEVPLVLPARPGVIQPEIIDTTAKLQSLIKRLDTARNPEQPIAWDTETTELDPFTAQLISLGCCWGKEPQQVAYIPLNHKQGTQLSQTQVLTALVKLFESDRHPKVFQNAKFDRLILKHQGVNLQGVVFDTLLASYVLHPEQTHNLTDLCRRYLSDKPDIVALSYKDLGLSKKQTIADLAITAAAEYCGLDAYSTYLLVEPLQKQLSQYPELIKLLAEIELPLEPILAEMEDRGIRVDRDYLKELSQQLESDLHHIETEAYAAAGETFNLGSPKQLGDILFEKLGLNRKKSRKTKTGYSTDQATLEKLQGDHPIIDIIANYRTLSKLKSTYVDALPTLIKPQTQRVHTHFNQTVTTTGRLSSSDPNLQNIPIRTEFSRKIRQAFLPQENWLLVSADYSQIELRILAHLSQEPVLLEAYQTGQDVHRVTAQLLFDKTDISPAERNLGKTINFGVIYGMGAQRFAREAGVSAEEGRQFIDRYRQTYSQVFDYLERSKKQAIADGFVTTIFGRRRYFEFVSESLRKLKGSDPDSIELESLEINYADVQLLRAAANAPIQGSSADIIKVAMVKISQLLKHYQAKLLLQVHDELIFEIPLSEWENLQTDIKIMMESAVSLTIPLVVDIHAGKNWMEAK